MPFQAGADPCAETQLRIPGFVPPTYPLKEAWSTEAVASGAAIARHLASQLERQQAAGPATAPRRSPRRPTQPASSGGLSREAALIAAACALRGHDAAAAVKLAAAAGAAPPTPAPAEGGSLSRTFTLGPVCSGG